MEMQNTITAFLSITQSKRSQKSIVALFYWLATLCDGVARIAIPLYFASIGFSPISISIMFVCYEISGLLTNLFSGFFINRVGYRTTFVLALFLHSIASLGYLLLDPSLGFIATLLLVNILRAFRGIGEELMKTTSSAWFRQFTPKNQNLFSIQILLGGRESIKGCGLLLGGLFITWLNFQYTFLLLGLITLISALLSLYLLDNINEKYRVPYLNFSHIKKELSMLAAIRACLYAGRDIWLVLAIPIVLTQQGVSALHTASILAGGLIIFGIAQPFFARFVKSEFHLGRIAKKKWRYRPTLPAVNISLAIIPLIALYMLENLTGLFLVILGFNLLAGIATAPHNHLHLKYTCKKSAAVDISYYKSIAHIGKVIAILSSGILLEYSGIYGCIIGSSICLLIATLLSLRLAVK